METGSTLNNEYMDFFKNPKSESAVDRLTTEIELAESIKIEKNDCSELLKITDFLYLKDKMKGQWCSYINRTPLSISIYN